MYPDEMAPPKANAVLVLSHVGHLRPTPPSSAALRRLRTPPSCLRPHRRLRALPCPLDAPCRRLPSHAAVFRPTPPFSALLRRLRPKPPSACPTPPSAHSAGPHCRLGSPPRSLRGPLRAHTLPCRLRSPPLCLRALSRGLACCVGCILCPGDVQMDGRGGMAGN
ncbi:hypothetical protein DENSPDRAFT_886559 [Dentipellis sp. KUC8613]|nr:hypothetical protein DENSPDRAFT_886559 [Dentipellis sp. KUC8613]